MRSKLALLAGTHLAALALGHQLAPWEMLDAEVKQTGFFQADTLRSYPPPSAASGRDQAARLQPTRAIPGVDHPVSVAVRGTLIASD